MDIPETTTSEFTRFKPGCCCCCYNFSLKLKFLICTETNIRPDFRITQDGSWFSNKSRRIYLEKSNGVTYLSSSPRPVGQEDISY